jgi:L-fuculose-phosphate aldolase
MPKTEREIRQDIVEIGRMVWQKGWVAANDGNITVRLDSERVMCTPTGVSKGMMHPDDMIIVDMQGRKILGQKQGTSEIAMHLAIYNLRPDVHAVVHAHPPVATSIWRCYRRSSSGWAASRWPATACLERRSSSSRCSPSSPNTTL